MRILLFLIGMAMAGSIAAAEPIHVDGILVYGNTHDVSAKDIREAAAASGSEMPVAEEVLSSREIHVYSTWDLGWRPVGYVEIHYPDGIRREWNSEAWDITSTPAVFRFIRGAETAYVFPVPTPLDPHLDIQRSRQLRPEALRGLKLLLGREKNWFHASDDRIRFLPEPANVGFLFRQQNNEVVLFLTSGGYLQGTLDGENTSGSLTEGGEQALETWKRHYAKFALPPN